MSEIILCKNCNDTGHVHSALGNKMACVKCEIYESRILHMPNKNRINQLQKIRYHKLSTQQREKRLVHIKHMRRIGMWINRQVHKQEGY